MSVLLRLQPTWKAQNSVFCCPRSLTGIVARGELQTAWVCTEEQLADALTKGRWDILKRLDTALRLGSFCTDQDQHNTHRGRARMHKEHRDATP